MNNTVIEVLVALAFLLFLAVVIAAAGAICFYLHKLISAINTLDGSTQNALSDANDTMKNLTNTWGVSVLKVGEYIKSGVDAQDKTVAKLSESIERISFVQEKTANEVKAIVDLPKHVLAYAKMGLAMVQEVQKLRACVQDFSSLVMKTDNRKLQNLILPDEEEQNTVFEVQSLLAMDPTITENEAREKVTAAREREMSMSVD